MKKLCKYEFNCGSFLKHTIRAAEARCESILLKMFLKHVFKSCSGMLLLAVAAGSSFRPAGAQINFANFANFANFVNQVANLFAYAPAARAPAVAGPESADARGDDVLI